MANTIPQPFSIMPRTIAVQGVATDPVKRGPGRPKGSLNKGRLEHREWIAKVLSSPEYRASLEAQAKNGTLPPQLHIIFHYYFLGKPIEKMEMTVTDNRETREMGYNELVSRANDITNELKELAVKEAAIASRQKETV